MCALSSWEHDYTMIHSEGKKSQWSQSNGLGFVPIWNCALLFVWNVHVMYHIIRHHYWPSKLSLMATIQCPLSYCTNCRKSFSIIHFTLLFWPLLHSPDINTIEPLWNLLNQEVKSAKISSFILHQWKEHLGTRNQKKLFL